MLIFLLDTYLNSCFNNGSKSKLRDNLKMKHSLYDGKMCAILRNTYQLPVFYQGPLKKEGSLRPGVVTCSLRHACDVF